MNNIYTSSLLYIGNVEKTGTTSADVRFFFASFLPLLIFISHRNFSFACCHMLSCAAHTTRYTNTHSAIFHHVRMDDNDGIGSETAGGERVCAVRIRCFTFTHYTLVYQIRIYYVYILHRVISYIRNKNLSYFPSVPCTRRRLLSSTRSAITCT